MIEEIKKGKAGWYKLLLYLGKSKNKVFTTQIRRGVGMAYSSTSSCLNKLEKKGVVVCFTGKDKRVKYWKLSAPKGREVYNLLLKLEGLMK